MISTLIRRPWILGLVGIAILLLIPGLVPDQYFLHTMILCFIFGLLAVSWDILSGYTGQMSFGHAGFFAFGGYMAAILSRDLLLPAELGVVVAALGTCIFGALIAIPALRLWGPYLAIVTLGVAELVRLTAHNWMDFTGGPFGTYGYASFGFLPSDQLGVKIYMYYIVLLTLLVVASALSWVGDRTRTGQAFKAIREDEVLAITLGINTTAYKVLAFSISAFVAGVAGAFYAYYVLLVSPWTASPYVTQLVIGMTIVGGIGTIWGAVLGGIGLYLITEYFRFIGPVYNLIALGLVIMLAIIFLPGGIMGALRVWAKRYMSRQAASAGARVPGLPEEGGGAHSQQAL